MKKSIFFALPLLLFLFGFYHLTKPFVNQKKTNFGYDLEISNEKSDRLNKLKTYLSKHSDKFDSIVVNVGNQRYFETGQTEKPLFLASIRKSILSILIGIAESKSLIDINKTLNDLNIDESKYPLSPTEKSASVKDLLMSRSGVYIESGGETKEMKKNRPERGTYKPGEFFYYNNWDFNVLGYIFEQEVKMTIGEAFNEWLAKPLSMQDFDVSQVTYTDSSQSQYPSWWLYLSARDLSKIGSLVLNKGQWNNKTILPNSWIEQSTQPYSKSRYDDLEYFGYSWWIDSKRQIIAGLGVGNQALIIDEKNNFCFTLQKDIGSSYLSATLYKFFGKPIPGKMIFEIYDIMSEQ